MSCIVFAESNYIADSLADSMTKIMIFFDNRTARRRMDLYSNCHSRKILRIKICTTAPILSGHNKMFFLYLYYLSLLGSIFFSSRLLLFPVCDLHDSDDGAEDSHGNADLCEAEFTSGRNPQVAGRGLHQGPPGLPGDREICKLFVSFVSQRNQTLIGILVI